jgi:hypothetical protein
MKEIVRFVLLAQSDRSATEPCEQFGISRKTGYRHLDRYAVAGTLVREAPAAPVSLPRALRGRADAKTRRLNEA